MKLVQLDPRPGGAVAHVRELLARCEAGEVVSVTVLEEHPGGTYAVHGSTSSDKFRTAGLLLDAARLRLENNGG